MRKMAILTALLSLLFLTIASQAAAAAAPEISFNYEAWELGTHPQGISVYHDVVITNTGDAPLTIKDIDPPCGCTVVDRGQYPKVLAPGEIHTVNVSFNTLTYNALMTRYIIVTSDDPFRPVVQLTFTCNVVAYYTPTSTASEVPTTTVSTTTIPTTIIPTTTTTQSPVSPLGAIAALSISALVLRRYAR